MPAAISEELDRRSRGAKTAERRLAALKGGIEVGSAGKVSAHALHAEGKLGTAPQHQVDWGESPERLSKRIPIWWLQDRGLSMSDVPGVEIDWFAPRPLPVEDAKFYRRFTDAQIEATRRDLARHCPGAFPEYEPETLWGRVTMWIRMIF